MNTYQRELTDKQLKFCNLYLSGLNATRAALQAGYSRGTAENGRIMGLPLVRKYLDEHQSEQSAGDVKVGADRLLAELCKVAFANVANCFNTNGSLKQIDDIDPDTMAGIESISFSATGAVKIKMFNKMQAIEKIARRTCFYKEVEKAKPAAGPVVMVAAANHPDFVDDSFDVAPAIQEMEKYMSGETGDDPTEEEIAAIALTSSAQSGKLKAESDVPDEANDTDAWMRKTYAKELESIKLERKLKVV